MENQVSNKKFFKAILNCNDNVQLECRVELLANCRKSTLKLIENEVTKSLIKSKKELIKDEYQNNKNFNRTHFAKEIGVSREYVLRIIKNLK